MSPNQKKQQEIAPTEQESAKSLARSIAAINSITDALSRSLDFKTVIEQVIEAVADYIQAPAATIFSLDEAAQSLTLICSKGFSEEALKEGSELPLQDSFSGTAVAQKSIIISENLAQDKRLVEQEQAILREQDLKSAVSMPVLFQAEVLGVMSLFFDQNRTLDQQEEDTLLTIGKKLGRAMAVRGVTVQKRIEEEYRKLSTAVEQSANLVLITNVDGVIEYVNPAFEALTGFTKEEVIGQTPSLLKSGMHDAAYYTDLWNTILAGKAYQGTTINKKKDGDLYYEEKTITPIKDEQGQITHFLSTSTDITERVELDTQLRESLDRRSRQVHLSTQIAQEIAAAPNLDELYHAVVTQVKEQFGYYHTQLLRYDPALEIVALVVGYGEVGERMLELNHSVPMGVGIIGTAAATGQSILRTRVSEDPDWRPNALLPDTKGELAVPIRLGDKILGVLDVQSNVSGQLNADDQIMLEGLCGQIAIAIESTTLRQEMEARLNDLHILQRQMSREGWSDYQQTKGWVPGYQFDRAGLKPIASSALNGNSENGRAANNMLVSDSIHVPLKVRGESIGVIGIQDDPEKPLSEDDQEFLQAISEELSEALEAARLFEQTQSALAEQERLTSELETVAQVSTAASTILEVDALLQSVVDLSRSSFDLYHTHIYLVNEDTNKLILKAGAGNVGRLMTLEGREISLDAESVVARAARTRQGVIENKVRKTLDFLPHPLLPNTRSEMAVPMVVGDKLVGVLDLQSEEEERFTEEELQIQKTLAAQVAVAVENAQQYAEQVQTATKLRELDQLKSEFLASMSHELRTPLNSIIGFADVLLEGLDGDLNERMEEDVRLIRESGSHLRELIGDILDMSKIEAGRMELRYEEVDLRQMANDIISTANPLAQEKHLNLYLDLDEKVTSVQADRTRLRQVFWNIMGNAIKFTEKGSVTLSLQAKEDHVLCSIRDTGIGIKEENISVVFEQFRQIDGGLNRAVGGTGLGMPITKKLVEIHGGNIWIESVVGQGTTFLFTLPYEAQPASAVVDIDDGESEAV